jgi:hypothetical protein
MTERERWVVYPLLFLALGAALRDKLFDRTTSRSIVCQELTVLDDEPMPNRPNRVLAKIGRTDPAPGGLPRGYLLVNGEVEVVDDLARGPQSAPVILAKLGPVSVRGVPVGGLLAINGQVDVQGLVNARQYAFQGMPIVPTLRGVLPGVSWPDLIQALQQSMQGRQQTDSPAIEQPDNPPAEQSSPSNDPPADQATPSENSPTSESSQPSERLADPVESR